MGANKEDAMSKFDDKMFNEIIEMIDEIQNESKRRNREMRLFGEAVIMEAVDRKLSRIDVIIALAKLIETFAIVPQPEEGEDEDDD